MKMMSPHKRLLALEGITMAPDLPVLVIACDLEKTATVLRMNGVETPATARVALQLAAEGYRLS